VVVAIIGATVPVFCLLGAVVWYQRHPKAESWMVWAYLVETLGYVHTNQRRVILVLPVVTIWYVAGAVAAWKVVADLSRRTISRTTSRTAASVIVAAAVLVAGTPTAFGFTRDYLFPVGDQSSEFARSPAMSLLKALGPASAVVETDYRGSVAYFSGHRTAWTAFAATYAPKRGANAAACTAAKVHAELRADDAMFLVVGDFNYPGLVDSPCLFKIASSPSTASTVGAVRLLSTSHDQTSVFELLGPNSSRQGLADWTASVLPTSAAKVVKLPTNGNGDSGGRGYEMRSSGGRAVFEWSSPAPVEISQVSVGSVTSTSTVKESLVAVRLTDGTWQTLAAAPGTVGDGGSRPYLLASPRPGVNVVAVRVSVLTTGTAEVAYVNAIGPVSRATESPVTASAAPRALKPSSLRRRGPGS
jgi:hypothetical protein